MPLLGNNKEKHELHTYCIIATFFPLQLRLPSESKKISDFDMHGSMHRR